MRRASGGIGNAFTGDFGRHQAGRSAYEIHNGQYDQQLPKAMNEALCAVERIDADQHIGDVSGDADSFENQSISLDFRVCCKSQRYAPLLHLRAVKMHHAHRALADTDGANQNEQIWG